MNTATNGRRTDDGANAPATVHSSDRTPALQGRERPSHERRPKRGPAPGWRLAFRTGAGRPRGFLRFWPVWERVMWTFFPVQPIPNAPHDVFLIHLTRYHHGKPITLPDGTQVGKGDWICELHLNNPRMAEYAGRGQYVRLLRDMGEDLRALAAYLAQAPEGAAVKSLWALTLLSRGARRLGFTVRPRPVTIHAWFDRFFMMGLLALYNARGTARLREGSVYANYPEEIWLSRGELLRRYGTAADTH
jgi:hypothetical protein